MTERLHDPPPLSHALSPRARGSSTEARGEQAVKISADPRRKIDDVQIVCACTFVVASLLFWMVHRALIDDAYITLSYARNLAFHGHWGLIPQEPANTATSPLFVFLLASATVVLRSPIWAAGFAFVGANVLLSWWAARTAQTLGLGAVSAGLAVALVLLNPLILSATGMETTLAVALIVGLLCYAVQGRPVAFGVVAGLAALTRPDLVIFVGLLSLSTAAIRRRLPSAVIAAAVVSGPWMVWSWFHFGSAIPDTFVLKTLQHSFGTNTFKDGPFAMLHKNAAATLASFAAALVGSILLSVVVSMRLRAGTVDRRFDPVLALGAGGIGYYIAYSLLGVPPYQWYYCPAIGALSVFVGMLLPHVLAHAARAAPARRRLVVIGQAVLAVTVLAEGVVVVGHDLPWRESVMTGNWATPSQYARIGTSLRARIGDQTVKSPNEIGTLAFYCQCAIVDHYSDRGWVIPQVEKRIAEAGPVARLLLRLNYRRLDRNLLPRPPEYTLLWAPGNTDDPDTWNVTSSETGRGHIRLLHQHFDSTAIDPLARDVVASLPPGRGPVVLGVSSPFNRYYQFRLARELRRRHVLVRLDPASEYSKRRTYDGQPIRARLTVSSGYDINRLASRPAQIFAYVGTVSRARRVEIAKRGRELAAMHRAHELTDREYFFQATALPNLGTDLAVIAY